MIELAGPQARGRDADNMTREHKLALILGFSVVLVVGVLISDHFSSATAARLDDLADETASIGAIDQTHASAPIRTAPSAGTLPGGFAIDGEPEIAAATPEQPVFSSGSEALLHEMRRSWILENAVPAAELDGPAPADPAASTPINALFKPVESTRQAESIPEPTIILSPAAGSDQNPGAVPTKSHRVAEDESLWSIAQRYYGDGALYARLAAFNRDVVGDDDTIHVGTTLRIPPKSALTGEKPAPTAAPRQAPTAATTRKYTVAEGDTLGGIAQRLLGSSRRWKEIVELNGIEDPDVVPVGTKLKIPAAR